VTNERIPEPDIDIDDELNIPNDVGQEHTIARRLALQILYELDTTEHPRGEALAQHLARYALQRTTTNYVVQLVNGITDEIERLDMIIQTIAPEHPVDEIAVIDRNVLRIATYEYGMIGSLPVGVVANEAVQLARLFGSDASMNFVNGVLGSILNDAPRLQAMLTVELPDDDDYDDDDEYNDEENDTL
jgi:transcription antitermination protein NusB